MLIPKKYLQRLKTRKSYGYNWLSRHSMALDTRRVQQAPHGMFQIQGGRYEERALDHAKKLPTKQETRLI